MNNAILSLPYEDGERMAAIRKYSSMLEFEGLFENLAKQIKFFDINFIIGRQKLYFFSIYFFLKNVIV